MSRFGAFVLKAAALLSFCGGPLLIADELKPRVGAGWAPLALTFWPIVLMIFGAFPLGVDSEEEPDRMDSISVWAGLLGVVVLLVMDAYAMWRLSVIPPRADLGLMTVGILVGVLSSIWYVALARRFLRRD